MVFLTQSMGPLGCAQPARVLRVLGNHRTQDGARGRSACTHASKDNVSNAAASEEDTVDAIERKVKRTSLKAQRAAKKAARKGQEKPFQRDSSVQDALEGRNLTPNQVFEGQAILILGFIFSLCILEGIIVAASGFLPESADAFIEKYVYSAFSPTVGLFLTCSTVYGVWKIRQDKI